MGAQAGRPCRPASTSKPSTLPTSRAASASAVGDDVGGHRRAVLAVALVDVLDDALALIAARQVDVDVRPFAALFGEKALEEQVHPDRIDGGDAERVADRAVGRRAAPLAEDAAARGRSARCPRR